MPNGASLPPAAPMSRAQRHLCDWQPKEGAVRRAEEAGVGGLREPRSSLASGQCPFSLPRRPSSSEHASPLNLQVLTPKPSKSRVTKNKKQGKKRISKTYLLKKQRAARSSGSSPSLPPAAVPGSAARNADPNGRSGGTAGLAWFRTSPGILQGRACAGIGQYVSSFSKGAGPGGADQDKAPLLK